MKYLKGHWNESRGDEFDEWGTSDWYFECESEMWVARQIEIYANGSVLHYDREHLDDRFGGLSEKPTDAEYETDLVPIEAAEFEDVWASRKPLNW
jgi:hypothetical protein